MKLLDPNEIRKDKSQSAEESQQRNNALAREESRLARAINKARENAKTTIAEIELDFQTYRAETEAKRDTLKQEVGKLESRRADALKPINELRKSAEETVQKAEKLLVDINRQKESMATDKEKNQDFAESLQDRSHDLNAREKKITVKEQAIEQEQLKQKNSSKDLGNQWFKLGQATTAHNKEIEKLEQKAIRLATIEEAQQIRQEQQDKREIEQNQHDRAIKDKYDTLGKAVEEMKAKYPKLKT